MGYPNPRGALKQYGQVATQAGVAVADPHRLIQMLMEGALEKIATAKGMMARGDIAKKGQQITWAISIIDGLRVSLDKKAGGDIARNLDDLYDYMERRLFQANLENDALILDEVSSLLRDIKSAWDAIPEEVRQTHGSAHPDPSRARLGVG
ncbi:flagellar export chaperone FliS [Endothiovibrio diazotrophicus]